MPVRALEFYCGIGQYISALMLKTLIGVIGGLHFALKRSGVDGSVVQAFDWDQTACQVYSANFPQSTVQKVPLA